MIFTLEQLEARSKLFYAHLEEQGVPLNLHAFKVLFESLKTEEKEVVNRIEVNEGIVIGEQLHAEYFEKVAVNYKHSLPKNKDGSPQTSEFIIGRYAKKVPALLELQKVRKLRRKISILTTLSQNVKNIKDGTGWVYPKYLFDEELGRVSASIVKVDNWEVEIRNLVSLPGYDIFVADYKRIEPKVLAVLSKDKVLLEDLKEDVYVKFAAFVYGKSEVTEEQRFKAKTAWLAYAFGNTSGGIAAQLSIPIWEAKKFVQKWKERYPAAYKFLEACGEEAWRTGKIITPSGRVKIADVFKGEAYVKRLGRNNRIQTTAAEIARWGFSNVWERVQSEECKLLFLGTVHDSIVLAVKPQSFEDIYEILHEEMCTKNDPEYQLEITIKQGSTWGSVVELAPFGRC